MTNEGWFRSADTVPVELNDCFCPGYPHENGDAIYIRGELSPEGGLAASQLVRQARLGGWDAQRIEAALAWSYARSEIVAWTFLDADGRPVPCTPENINNLRFAAVWDVGQKASNLYTEELLRPLVVRASTRSASGPTADSTSPTPPSSHRRRKR